MNRSRHAILVPLLAVLAVLLGLAETASAAFNPAAQNPHYGNFILQQSEASADWPLDIADPTKGNGEWIYDSASGVPAYVRQNPWTYYDPLGLETHVKHYPPGKNGLGSSVATVSSRKYILFGEKRVTAMFGAIGGTQKEREAKLKKLSNSEDFDSVVIATTVAIVIADRIIESQKNGSKQNQPEPEKSQRDIQEENDDGYTEADSNKTFYHKGDLKQGNGKVRGVFSTTEDKDVVERYHPDQKTQKFVVPKDKFEEWKENNLVEYRKDTIKEDSSIVDETRFIEPASTEMNDYHVKEDED